MSKSDTTPPFAKNRSSRLVKKLMKRIVEMRPFEDVAITSDGKLIATWEMVNAGC